MVRKVKGTANKADALTECHTAAKLEELCSPHGVVRAALTEAAVGPRGACRETAPRQRARRGVKHVRICDSVDTVQLGGVRQLLAKAMYGRAPSP